MVEGTSQLKTVMFIHRASNHVISSIERRFRKSIGSGRRAEYWAILNQSMYAPCLREDFRSLVSGDTCQEGTKI